VDRYLGQNFNNQQPFWFYLALVLVGVLPWIPLFLTACYEHCRHFITYLKLTRETSHFTALLVIWPLAILIFFSIPASKPPGYILPALPPLALLMAISLARLFNKPSSSTTGQKFLGLGCFLLFSLLAIISFAIIPFIKANFGEAIIYSLKVVGTSTALFSLVIIIQNYCQYRKWLPVTLLISALTFNLTLVLALPYISKSQNSIKPLAEQLKPLLEPGDQVVSYLKYYQDLPLYLNRKQPIIMVINNWQNPQLAQGDNWKSNTYIGSQLIKGNYHWLVNQDTFIKQLTTNQRFYIFTSYAVYQGLEKEIKLYLIAKHHDKVLVSNQPLANKG
jgi:4-amino-4-deoxy-L-arabinose transferase-like glycosyltransferase